MLNYITKVIPFLCWALRDQCQNQVAIVECPREIFMRINRYIMHGAFFWEEETWLGLSGKIYSKVADKWLWVHLKFLFHFISFRLWVNDACNDNCKEEDKKFPPKFLFKPWIEPEISSTMGNASDSGIDSRIFPLIPQLNLQLRQS